MLGPLNPCSKSSLEETVHSLRMLGLLRARKAYIQMYQPDSCEVGATCPRLDSGPLRSTYDSEKWLYNKLLERLQQASPKSAADQKDESSGNSPKHTVKSLHLSRAGSIEQRTSGANNVLSKIVAGLPGVPKHSQVPE